MGTLPWDALHIGRLCPTGSHGLVPTGREGAYPCINLIPGFHGCQTAGWLVTYAASCLVCWSWFMLLLDLFVCVCESFRRVVPP